MQRKQTKKDRSILRANYYQSCKVLSFYVFYAGIRTDRQKERNLATTYIEILRKPRMRERKHQLMVSEKAQVKVRTRGKKSSSREKKKRENKRQIPIASHRKLRRGYI